MSPQSDVPAESRGGGSPSAASTNAAVASMALQELTHLSSFFGPAGAPRRRATSVSWWRASSLTQASTWSDCFTDTTFDTLDTEDSSVNSTRASLTMTESSRGSRRGFSVMVRGARSPNSHRYRGRSVTRRGRQMSGAALRHRHPTHTPSRGPTGLRPSAGLARSALHLNGHVRSLLHTMPPMDLARFGQTPHVIVGQVREDDAEAG
mmetsp:Transcript_92528/g.193449  ORF Transcript_92528/g.193449 Transcript_92528/m.193449 type:complete len:207 (-) Transcript_92528:388-1008(-)|eukprot:CAMPEP_0206487154 /NCGR_PEP_ID=MMETSP0324_2-20121206/41452_1 /ASSEMBLY_ACC=CAM_ASM_000836 /TAXON_ID=2866 /ORGANISM="Crypthecodinium cohnii, Strain Seligo" /LENGTH=206 /DNA_ID=CAMNT_0053965541 /DNA_START=519 /DNA_END=1139 /DNA_ORIENTATION=+